MPNQSFRKSMTWLHTYSGLLIGWLIFAIWVTGTLAYFTPEITLWMKPELGYSKNKTNLIDQSLDLLHEQALDADRWVINLPSNRDSNWTIEWRGKDVRKKVQLSTETQNPITPRQTQGGNFFRSFHYTLLLRGYGGRYYAGLAAFVFLVAVFTGIFTHRRFIKDFFTLRKTKLLNLLRDFHALAGIITIPFNIMICVSALAIYAMMYMPWTAEHYFEGGERAVYREIIPSLKPIKGESKSSQPITEFSQVQTNVDLLWQGSNQIDTVTFDQPYSDDGRIILQRVKDTNLSRQAQRLVYSAATGELLEGYKPESVAAQTRRILWGLHEAKFASPLLRWLLFFLGAISSMMIATGLIYWVKISTVNNKQQSLWGRLVARLNIAGIAGLILAIASFFVSNRLIPIESNGRMDLEIRVFVLVWLFSLLHSFMRRPIIAWREQTLFAGSLFLLAVFVDIFQDFNRFTNAYQQNNLPYLGCMLSLFVTGLILVRVSLILKQNRPRIEHKIIEET